MEAHGAPVAALGQKLVGLLPDRLAAPLAEKAGVDRLSALYAAIHAVRRGGTVSVIGVYGGGADPMPMMELFDKGVQLRMGQAHVKRWIPRSSRCSKARAIRSGPRTSPRTSCPSPRLRTATRSSRRRRTSASRWC